MSQSFDSSAILSSNTAGGHSDAFLVEELIRRIQAGHEAAANELREILAKGLGWYMARGRQMNVEIRIRQVLDTVLRAVKEQEVTTVAELTSLTRNLARQASDQPLVGARSEEPCDRWHVERMKQVLRELSPHEREALLRYFEGQAPQRIYAELGIAEQTLTSLRVQVKASYVKATASPR